MRGICNLWNLTGLCGVLWNCPFKTMMWVIFISCWNIWKTKSKFIRLNAHMDSLLNICTCTSMHAHMHTQVVDGKCQLARCGRVCVAPWSVQSAGLNLFWELTQTYVCAATVQMLAWQSPVWKFRKKLWPMHKTVESCKSCAVLHLRRATTKLVFKMKRMSPERCSFERPFACTMSLVYCGC